jgi:fluoride exporter
MLIELLFVGCGGFIGCILRYLIVTLSLATNIGSIFPWGVFIANITGCFLIGLMGAWIQLKTKLSPHMMGFLFTGLLGGLTTFSTFAHDSVTMFQARYFVHALLNITAQVFFGLLAVWLGFRLFSLFIHT